MNDNNSLAHTTWNFKYHIVFAPKYRRMVGKRIEHIAKMKEILIDKKRETTLADAT